MKEVVPILKTNSDGLKKTLDELVKQYKIKQDDMEKWKVRLILQHHGLRNPFGCVHWAGPNTNCVFLKKKNNIQVVQS